MAAFPRIVGARLFVDMLDSGSLPAVMGEECKAGQSALWVNEKEPGVPARQAFAQHGTGFGTCCNELGFPSATLKLAQKLESLVLFHELHDALVTT